MSFLHEYDYSLPEELIALEPAEPRDSARLFIYHTETDSVQFGTFAQLDRYIPNNSFFVFNQTKVVPARLHLKKQRGRSTDILFLFNEPQPFENLFKAISSRHLPVGQTLEWDRDHLFTIVRQDERFFYLRPEFPREEFFRILDTHGRMPLPHYLQSTKLEEDVLRHRYQTVFASQPGSVAAPTASLHFTNDLLERLQQKHKLLKVTHHVGLATFTPVLPENLEQRKLLEEWYEIEEVYSSKFQAMREQQSLIAVGTTAVRALESFARSGKPKGKTDLFIFPPYEFHMVDALITNFHLPKTSLMMLVQAFLQHKGARRSLKELYEIAIRERFRFYSFGDAMLLL